MHGQQNIKKKYEMFHSDMTHDSVSQLPGRGPVPGPDINYTGPREA